MAYRPGRTGHAFRLLGEVSNVTVSIVDDGAAMRGYLRRMAFETPQGGLSTCYVTGEGCKRE